jgi:putative membrane protein
MSLIRSIVLSIIANALAMFAVSALLGGYLFINASSEIWGFLVVGALLGLLNAFVKPILKAISLPFTLITMGLFLIVINAVILWFLDSLLEGFLDFFKVDIIITESPYWLSLFLVAIVLGIFNSIAHWLIKGN